jgi:hypothetical protein
VILLCAFLRFVCGLCRRYRAEQMPVGAFSDKDFSEGHAQPRALPVAPLPVALTKLETLVFGQ